MNESITHLVNNIGDFILETTFPSENELGYFIGYLYMNKNNGTFCKHRYIWENYVLSYNYKETSRLQVKYTTYPISISYDNGDGDLINISKDFICGFGTEIELNDSNWITKWFPEDHHMHHPEFKKKIFTFLHCLKKQEIITGNKHVYKIPKYILFEIIGLSMHVIIKN